MKNSIFRFLYAISAFWILGLSIDAQTRTDTFAITNAQVVTASGPILSRATIVVREGLIEAVGENAKVPADARVIDGTGLTVYPGLFDTYTSLGIPVRQQQGQQQPGQQFQIQTPQTAQTQSNSNYLEGLRPEEEVISQLRAGDAQFETNRNAGFTTVLTVSRDGIFNGQSAVINLAGDSVSKMIIRAPFGEHVTFRTIGSGQYPNSLMGSFAALRQMFLDAQRLQEAQKLYEKNPKGLRRPGTDASLEALFPLINGAMPIVLNANSEVEIIRALDLAQEFNLKAIIAGGLEAWRVADRLKTQNVPVLLSLNFPKRTTTASADADPEPLEILRLRAEIPKGAARLQQAGVKFAFQSGGMQNISDFMINAGKAVEGGLNRNAAIRAMTLNAAEILGVENRLGSIEPGKIANLFVVRGDLFAKDRTITQVFVDGRLFEPKLPVRPMTGTGTTQPAAFANVGGSYNITVEIPGQSTQGTLILVQQGANLTGSWQTQQQTAQIKDGKVTAEGFSFSISIQIEGNVNDLAVSGRVTGNQISGTVAAPSGAIPFNGTKIP